MVMSSSSCEGPNLIHDRHLQVKTTVRTFIFNQDTVTRSRFTLPLKQPKMDKIQFDTIFKTRHHTTKDGDL